MFRGDQGSSKVIRSAAKTHQEDLEVGARLLHARRGAALAGRGRRHGLHQRAALLERHLAGPLCRAGLG